MAVTTGQSLRVLIVIPSMEVGGAERALLGLLEGLDRRRCGITLFLYQRRGLLLDRLPADVRVIAGAEQGRFAMVWPLILIRLCLEARRHDMLVGALEQTATYFAWVAARLAGIPVAGWIHTDLPARLEESGRLRRMVARWIYPRIRHRVFVTRSVKDSFQQWMANPPGENLVIPNALPSSAHPDAATGGARQPWKVVAIGRLVPEKAFDRLLDAVALLHAKGLPVRLELIGDGPCRRELELRASRLGLEDTVRFLGELPDPGEQLRAAQLLVLSSRYEGLGMVLLEGMAWGVPIVACRGHGGVAEVLGEGEYGLLVEECTPAHLAAGMERLLTDEALCREYVARYPDALHRYRPDRVAARWERFLMRVCRPRFPRRDASRPGETRPCEREGGDERSP